MKQSGLSWWLFRNVLVFTMLGGCADYEKKKRKKFYGGGIVCVVCCCALCLVMNMVFKNLLS